MNYIGKSFINPKGGVITVLYKEHKHLYCSCSICSIDEELHPAGSMRMTVQGFLREGIPCGCSTQPKWSKRQQLVRIGRVCEEVDYTFNGFVGDYVGVRTKLSLTDNVMGNTWSTTDISWFLRGSRNPKLAQAILNKANTKPIEDYITIFKSTGSYPEGTIFEKISSGDKVSKWRYFCPICSCDEYSLKGLCSNWFNGDSSALLKGSKSCRCSTNYVYTFQQRKFKCEQDCKRLGLSFVGLSGKHSRDSVDIICNNGHKNQIPVHKLDNYSCHKCYDNQSGFGFYKDLKDKEDTLYIIELSSDSERFIKVGRSFNIKERFKEFKKNYDVHIISLEEGTHEYIFFKEKDCHEMLSGYLYKPKISFGGSVKECFKDPDLSLIRLPHQSIS